MSKLIKNKPAPAAAAEPFSHDALVIRTCGADGGSHSGFKWPLTVGTVVTCPDWDSAPRCGGGLHGLLDGVGDWSLIDDDPTRVWQVIGVLRSEVVTIDSAKVKFPRGVVLYVGGLGGAMQLIQKASVTAIRAAAKENAATGDSGHAAATGDWGHAAATGDWGHAAATGDWGHAAATGDSGHAAATGDSGHAAATGYSGHAAATGDWGHAAATGDSGHAAATGDSGHAAATGDSGHAAATGYRGHAAATGYRGHAAATGYRGHAAATGDSGHAAATGDSGHAAATGYRGHAAATGDSGHAAATGKRAIAASLGWDGTAEAGEGGWVVLAKWKIDKNGDLQLVAVKTGKVGEGGLKAGVRYTLNDDGHFEAVS